MVEPTFGLDRTFLALLCEHYFEDKENKRVLLRLPKKLTPYKAAVFPLLANKQQLVAKAKEIFSLLQQSLAVTWDARGNIGKRYYAQDEIGTPYCVTIDFDTLEDSAVTVRDRDTTEQVRVKITELQTYLVGRL